MNNKSIQILRGSESYDPSKSDEVLLDGQPFYSKKTGEFFIGDGTSKLSELEPVTTNRLENIFVVDKENQNITAPIEYNKNEGLYSLSLLKGAESYADNCVTIGRTAKSYSARSAILGGVENQIGYEGLEKSKMSSINANGILGGYENKIVGSHYLDNTKLESTGSYNAAVGGWRNSIVNGNQNVLAGGYENKVVGDNNLISGAHNNVQSHNSFITGGNIDDNNSGNHVGTYNTTTKFINTMGCIVSGSYNEVGTDETKTTYNSTIVGQSNVVDSNCSLTAGYQLKNNNDYCTVLGRWSKETSGNHLFIIGDGVSDTNRHNAIELKFNIKDDLPDPYLHINSNLEIKDKNINLNNASLEGKIYNPNLKIFQGNTEVLRISDLQIQGLYQPYIELKEDSLIQNSDKALHIKNSVHYNSVFVSGTYVKNTFKLYNNAGTKVLLSNADDNGGLTIPAITGPSLTIGRDASSATYINGTLDVSSVGIHTGVCIGAKQKGLIYDGFIADVKNFEVNCNKKFEINCNNNISLTTYNSNLKSNEDESSGKYNIPDVASYMNNATAFPTELIRFFGAEDTFYMSPGYPVFLQLPLNDFNILTEDPNKFRTMYFGTVRGYQGICMTRDPSGNNIIGNYFTLYWNSTCLSIALYNINTTKLSISAGGESITASQSNLLTCRYVLEPLPVKTSSFLFGAVQQ